ncbi:hypothetical protein ACSSVY_004158 [Roseovarius sp. MBR-51]
MSILALRTLFGRVCLASAEAAKTLADTTGATNGRSSQCQCYKRLGFGPSCASGKVRNNPSRTDTLNDYTKNAL